MALSKLMLWKASNVLKQRPMRVASMGYPDILAGKDFLMKLLGEKYAQLEYRDDSEAICNRHRMKQHQVPYTESVLGLLGAELDVFDVIDERGCEIITDLNYPMPDEHLGQYDVVLDVGTLEHCFNIGQAAINMAELLKEGGYIFHENPFNWGNHGFYGLNPTWYYDFYGQNGFTVTECILIDRDYSKMAENVEPALRFTYLDSEANLFAAAQRNEVRHIKYPTQKKYMSKLG
jgi:hypothetical protein